MQEIKGKIVLEYKNLVHNLHVGKRYDYQHILNMINFLDIASSVNNPEILTSYFLSK